MTYPSSAFLDLSFWLTCLAILLLLLLSAFFAGSETALTAASRAKLRAQADRRTTGAATALAVSEDSERMIGTLLLGNNIVKILAAALATSLLIRLAGAPGVALATLVMTVLVLIFAEVLPRTVAITWPEAVALRVAPVIRVVIAVLAPIMTLIRALVRAILHGIGASEAADARIAALREEIVDAITQGHSEGAVEKDARDRLLGALDLGTRTVDEIMVHRAAIEMIDAGLSAVQIIEKTLASPHTRIPLYRDGGEDVIGILHVKDLLREVHKFRVEGLDLEGMDIPKIAMKPYFVPDTTTLEEQMREFLARRTHFALVVDEYGSLRGLITLEDILEEIVGDITDEMDVAPRGNGLKRAPDGDYLIDGGMTIRDLNRAMDWQLPDDEANTVAGLVIHEAMTIPDEGQVFAFHGFRFEVAARRENRIAKLKLRPLKLPSR